MEMTTVKYELGPGVRRLCIVEGDASANNYIKRRRRRSYAPEITCNEDGRQQKQPPAQQFTASSGVKRSSRFRGVSRHRWTGRFEAHLWDKGTWNPSQRKKGKQVYLGAYDEEESAARAYDLAAMKYWGTSTFTNFPVSQYEKEIEIMKTVTREEYLASLRRRSSGFSRGVSKYRGVARHHHNGRWEARIGRISGNKYLYLGTYSTQEEAAHAYDIAAIEYRGIKAITNFDLSTYIRWLRPGVNALASQETKPFVESQPETMRFNPISTTEKPIFHSNTLTRVEEDTLRKQDVVQRETPLGTSPSSTALGLLLRSSLFREMTGRTQNAIDKQIEENDNKFLMLRSGDKGVGGTLRNQVPSFTYMHSTDDNALPRLVSSEESQLRFLSSGIVP